MEAKHTPGPWLVDDKSSNDVYRYVLAECDDIHPVARVTLDGIRHDSVAEANARLIAAAPELLAAIQAMMYAGGKDEFQAAFDNAKHLANTLTT